MNFGEDQQEFMAEIWRAEQERQNAWQIVRNQVTHGTHYPDITAYIHGSQGSFVLMAEVKRVSRTVQPASPRVPKVLWSCIARLAMNPTRYEREWLPQLADMQYLYHERLKRGDRRGALLAIVHAHIYTVPKWLWFAVGSGMIFPIVKHLLS